MNNSRSIRGIKNAKFLEDGFCISNPFQESEITAVGIDFYNRLLMQAYKLSLVDEFVPKIYGDTVSAEEIDFLVIEVQKTNKRSVDFAVQELRECPALYSMVNQNFLSICSELLDSPESLLKIHWDGILVNTPKNEQRLYKFHTEQHYYPYRKNFINFWMPVIRDKTTTNGAMKIAHKGHIRNYSMSEYSGFSSKQGNDASEANYFYQLQIPPGELENLEILDCDIGIGDALFFNGNLPHTSTVNISSEPTYALIGRIYDYRADLTLSDNTGLKLYSAGDGGFPNLRPIPR